MSRRGRPTKQKQVHLDKKFHDCYVKGYDALHAANLIGTNKKTAYRYYTKITDEITSEHKEDYFERVQESLEQIIQSYDYLLEELHSVLDHINEKLSDGKPHSQLNHSKVIVIKEIKNILNEKAELKLNLPHHNKLEVMIKEQIKNYVKTN